MNYGFKQIAEKFGNYHPDYVRKLIGSLIKNGELSLKYWLGPNHTMIMDDSEIETAREKIKMSAFIRIKSC